MSLGLRGTSSKALLSGTSACPGCPENMAMRQLGMALGNNVAMVVVAGCSSVIQGMGPKNSFNYPVMNIAFAAGPAAASGMARAYKLRNKDVTVVVWAGDGGTADIGFGSMSGAAERNEDMIYLCVDNEAYMNSGGQRSGSTPRGARTPTTPEGKRENKKSIPFIMMAHNVPYVATASVGYPMDYVEKLRKAKSIKGFRYVQVLTPDPYGWLFDPSRTAEVAKIAVQTCYWPLLEYEGGKVKVSNESLHCIKGNFRRPLTDFTSIQGRFKGITEEELKSLLDYVDSVWDRIRSMM
ncbi:2-ketoisovalerate ferredoxin oxidoreductase [Sulfodiicoccus acidiphilus]|uniref:2-oxoacid oxidoreductase (ferredoxin) n=1 Tax=Sulfodiicoccus acidiphilus TaxID=1670455 RepID=A0A348B6E1_9CREN|nr:pyruvate synthase subunit PorB [Sulfodiicoccus acidiphilus]BBD73743.1 2-ketoisovalerate ferredoxin oxidoreductase [Sulfodiicoccus acidiphilus]GGT98019.1 2-ketoisovalerate ferredoxin oxidoreductase [Sulfodiicoccus acidiphilus]